jgi:hypothetical protein
MYIYIYIIYIYIRHIYTITFIRRERKRIVSPIDKAENGGLS